MPLAVKFLFGLGILAIVLGTLIFVKGQQFSAMGAAQPPPEIETVTSFTTKNMSWEITLASVGTLRAAQGATLEVELPGIVREILFENGQEVQEGDVLLRLDTRLEEAELESALATVELAELEFERTQSLVASEAAPQSQLDLRQAELRRARAAVENIEVLIDRKTLRAPFSGSLGIRKVNTGQFISTGTPVVSLQSFQPIFVDFSLPQQELHHVSVGDTVRVRLESEDRLYEGLITAINPEVNPRTRLVAIQATLPNEDSTLKPGMFARIQVVQNQTRTVTVILATAVLPATFGDSVFLITEPNEGELEKMKQGHPTGKVARQHFTRLGERRGDFIEVLEGLEPGQEIVSLGAFKLRNNIAVQITEENEPDPQLFPEVRNR